MVYSEIEVDGQKVKLYTDQWLYGKIQQWTNTAKRDDDFVAAIDGGEGTGKSVFALQIAKLFDPNFSLANICMNANEFKKQIKEAKRGTCVVYDEAFTGLSSKGALTEINKFLVELMMEMRQKNLKVLIVLPTFFMLEKYVALFRARCLFHVYRKQGSRGHWIYFGRKKKKLLYLLGKKFLSYKEPRSEKKGKFQNTYTVNEAEYRKKKEAAFVNKDRNSRDERHKQQKEIMWWYLTRKLGITQQILSDMYYFFDIDLDQQAVSRDLKALDEKIVSEIETPPDDEFINRLVKLVQTRNEPAMREIRKMQLENRAKAELEREKRLLSKKQGIKQPQNENRSSNKPPFTKKSLNNLGNDKNKALKSQKVQKEGENDAFNEFLSEK